jgi:hypothetical protein
MGKFPRGLKKIDNKYTRCIMTKDREEKKMKPTLSQERAIREVMRNGGKVTDVEVYGNGVASVDFLLPGEHWVNVFFMDKEGEPQKEKFRGLF